MRKTRRWLKPIGLGFCIAAALALVIVGLASCGSSTASKQNQTSSNGTKLPPGVTKADASQQSSAPTSSPAAAQAQSTAPAATQAAASPSAAADLVGARFTIVNATRPNTNKSAISSSAREVPGDYLELELTVFNNGANSMIDLSQYSFRLNSTGIAADTYADYYGTNGTFGAYVDTNVISGTLLNYSDLAPATYKVKVGETVSKVFLFYDLNPLTDAPNAGVTKDNSQLIIYKASGTDYGTQVAIPLSGYSF